MSFPKHTTFTAECFIGLESWVLATVFNLRVPSLRQKKFRSCFTANRDDFVQRPFN